MKWVYLLRSIAFEVLETTAMKMASEQGRNDIFWNITKVH